MFQEISIYTLVIYILLPFGAYLVKTTILNRLRELEDFVKISSNTVEVKEMINIKLDPIQEDLRDIKEDIRQIRQMLLRNRDRGEE